MVVRRRRSIRNKSLRRSTRKSIRRTRNQRRRTRRARRGGQSVDEMHAERNRIQVHIGDVLHSHIGLEEKLDEISQFEDIARQIDAFFRARGENDYADTLEHVHDAIDEITEEQAENMEENNNNNNNSTVVGPSYRRIGNNNNNNNNMSVNEQ